MPSTPRTALTSLTAVGALGRDYHARNRPLLEKEWAEGKTFQICNGGLFSIVHLPQLWLDGYRHIVFMARDGLQVAVLDLATGLFLSDEEAGAIINPDNQ